MDQDHQGPWQRTVQAHNTAAASTNKMHDDAVAASFGFRGGLVPGVDVWAYAVDVCIDRWGIDFIGVGTMGMRFVSPVYDGETVVAELLSDGSLTVRGSDGTVRATGSASFEPPSRLPPLIAVADVPEPAPDATAVSLEPGTVLGTLWSHHRADEHVQYLDDVRADPARYERGALCHPAYLARQANAVLARSVRLGPWIHVATTARHRGVARDGALLEVRGIVTDRYTHGGHGFVELEVAITADDEPVWDATHTAIWQPAFA